MTYFAHLNYTLGDEDARLEMALTPEGASVAAIAGCGSRLIPLLARRPSRVVVYDIGESQLQLTALRLAALRALTRDEFVGFVGYDDRSSPDERRRMFVALDLAPEVREGLGAVLERARWAPIAYLGRFERMIGQLATVNRLVTGASGRGLFDATTLEDQRRYLAERFPRRRFDVVVSVLGNSTVLNTLLYRGEFPAKNLPESTRSVYARIFERLFTEDLARASFFLQLAFFGRIPFEEGYPVECDPAVYAAARQAVASVPVSLVRGDVFAGVQQDPVDVVALSDVPSFLGPQREDAFLDDLVALRPGALVVVRGHLRVLTPASAAFEDLTERHRALIDAESTKLWTVHVYRRRDGIG